MTEVKGTYGTAKIFTDLVENKAIESIIENIGDTVDILKVLKPVYNFKAGN